MRRKDRAVEDLDGILEIIEKCKVIRLAMSDERAPYIVPLTFGYRCENGRFEFCFHCAGEGKKLDRIRANPRVAFEMDCDRTLVTAESPCGYSCRYQSVIGVGTASIVCEREEKKKLLSCYMKHQTGQSFEFGDAQADAVTVCRIEVEELSAKACV